MNAAHPRHLTPNPSTDDHREDPEKKGFPAGGDSTTDHLAARTEESSVIVPTRNNTPPVGRTVNAYLNFDGRCAEALDFYQQALGAEVRELMRFKDAPPSEGCTPSNPDLIMHASFHVGGSLLMASDCHGAGQPTFAGVSLALGVTDAADAARCFEALAVGGNVCLPLAATFWSPAFGVVTDRFGVTWMINTVPTPA